MSKIDELKALIPDFILDPINDELFTQYGIELENLNESSLDLLAQLFPQTATWGMKSWEQLLNLPVNEGMNLVIRRNRVIAKLSTINPMNYKNFSTIVSKYAEKTEVIQNFSDYSLSINLITTDNFNIILSDIINVIEEIKPAHLGYSLGLETQKSINIATSRAYAFNPLNMCGQFYCGDSVVISSYGRSYSGNATLHGDYNKNIKDYSLAGTILTGTNSEFESGITTIAKTYTSTLQEKVNESKSIKGYNYTGEILSSEEVLL